MLTAVFGLVLLVDAATEARFSVKMVESEAKATFMIIAGSLAQERRHSESTAPLAQRRVQLGRAAGGSHPVLPL